eukprot:EG_transcript_5474
MCRPSPAERPGPAEDGGTLRQSLRRHALTLSQMAAIDGSGPLLLRSLAEATMLVVLHVSFLHYVAQRWHALSGLADPFSQVSAIVPLSFTGWYLCFVHLGSRYMWLRRAPFVTRVFECMVVYNAHQTVLNLCCAIALIQEVRRRGMALWGNSYVPSEDQYYLSFLIWLHYSNSYLELLDTVFVVLRKKFTRVSFLHVYQRVLMLWSWFIVCRVACGGDSYFGAVAHCVVRVATYGYYLLALLNLPRPPRHYVTRLHLAQCLLCSIHALYVLWHGTMPARLAATELFAMVNMLVLSTDFHYDQAFAQPTPEVAPPVRPRLVFSFDSSGWLYLYHFGVARYLRDHYLRDRAEEDIAFSGASGGALVAWSLCDNTNLDVLIDHVISCRKIIGLCPWRMMPAVDRALLRFLPPGSHRRCSNRLRVLVTKVLPGPPFVMGEVATEFVSDKHLSQVLRASCHVPLVCSVRPYRITEGPGGLYYDGLFWSSGLGFVPWRSTDPGDKVIRVSGLGVWGAEITPRFYIPPWWALFPPPEEILWGMVEQGYYDAARVLQPKAATDPAYMVPDRVVKFQEAVYRTWMLTVLFVTTGVAVFLAAFL